MNISIKRLAARRSARAEVAFKRELIEARENAGLSQRQLADLMGVDNSTVSRIERLDSDPKLSVLRQYLTQCEAALNIQVVSRREVADEHRERHVKAVAKARNIEARYAQHDGDEVEAQPWSPALTMR